MRLVHTSDWHLGQRLHERPRDFEHRRFLDWLLELLVAQAADALVVAGDVFDSANPPAEAQRAYFEFLAACRRRLPELDVVVLGGNHDSPLRLDAPAELLRAVRVHVLGGLPRLPEALAAPGRAAGEAPEAAPSEAELDTGRAVIPLRRRGGEIAAWLVAVPYLRPTDLPSLLTAELLTASGDAATDARDRAARLEQASAQLLGSVRAIYQQLFDAARAQRQPGQALLAAGHCYLAQTRTSVDSERKIQLGNQLPLPVELFPPEVAYVALGHLHLGQCVAGQEHIRYSGSPIPLALSEADYRHQVLIVDFEGDRLQQIRAEPVPRSVEILRVPEQPLPLAEVLPLLHSLPARGPAEASPDERPYLEVRVRLGANETNAALRKTIEEATASAWPRLLRIAVTREDGSGRLTEPGGAAGGEQLRDLDPEEVLRRRYQRWKDDPDAAVPEPQLRLFRALLDQLHEKPQGGGPAAPADSRLTDAGGPP